MRKDMKLETMEELEKAATAQGISYEDFKQNMRNQIITQKVIGEEVGSHLSITKGRRTEVLRSSTRMKWSSRSRSS